MQIVRTEQPTGTGNRTRREEIVPLLTGTREAEPEMYLDCSESEGWAWDSNPNASTWDIQLEAVRNFIAPFEVLDSQAAEEQSGGSDEKGGVYCYPFSNNFQPIGHGDDDGDLNSTNFDRKIGDFIKKYFDRQGKPRGGTEIMTAIRAGDKHFLGEFRDEPRSERPVRARVVWTDGALNDADAFRAYLGQATPSDEGFGSHGEWDEVLGGRDLRRGRRRRQGGLRPVPGAEQEPPVDPRLLLRGRDQPRRDRRGHGGRGRAHPGIASPSR